MFRLLSDLEVALNELLVACRESADHFRDGAQLVTDQQMAAELNRLATERESFIQPIEHKIRALGDLPSVPDPDKEDGEMLLHHIGAAVSEDYTGKLAQQRIDAEKTLLQIIDRAKNLDEKKALEPVLNDLMTNVNSTLEKLNQYSAI